MEKEELGMPRIKEKASAHERCQGNRGAKQIGTARKSGTKKRRKRNTGKRRETMQMCCWKDGRIASTKGKLCHESHRMERGRLRSCRH